MKRILLFLSVMAFCIPGYAADNVTVQTADGTAVSASNPLPVHLIGGGGSSQWITNGTSIGTTGNVGINSSAPSQKLDVVGTVKATAFVGDGSGLTGVSGALSGMTPGYAQRATTASTLGSSLLYDNGTNAGIGSTAPQSKLEVVGTVKATSFQGDGSLLSGVATGLSGLNPGMLIRGLTATTVGSSAVIYSDGTNIGIGSTVPRAKLEVQGTGYFSGNVGIGSVAPQSAIDLGTGTLTANNINLTNTGNSGLGTATPQQKLEVVGTVKATSFQGDGSLLSGVSAGLSGMAPGYHQKAATATTLGNSLIYDNGTNIGIGSTVPQAKLDMQGSAYFNGNIGIGTFAPVSPLNIMQSTFGAVTDNFYLKVPLGGYFSIRAVTNASSPEWRVTTYNAGDLTFYPGGNFGVTFKSGSSAGNVGIGTSTPAGRLVVYGGNVGIGTTAPQTVLDVEGGVYVGNGNIGIGSSIPSQKLDVLGNVYINGNIGIGTTANTSALNLGGASGAPSYFSTNVGIGSSVPRQVLEVLGSVYASANIGVGSSAPGQILTVNGTASFGIGTTGSGYMPCCKSAVGTNCLWGYCTAITGAVCTTCN